MADFSQGLFGGGINDLLAYIDSRKKVLAQNVGGLLGIGGANQTPADTANGLLGDLASRAQGQLDAAKGTQSVFPEIRDQAQQQMLDGLLNSGGLLGQTVFHGTPHKFDKFDLSKIGTGEGAQAYGHGMYFAEEPSVARNYMGRPVAVYNIPQLDGDSAVMIGNEIISRHATPAAANKALSKVKAGPLLQADLPDSVLPKLLQWDKPLSEQPTDVSYMWQKAAKSFPQIDKSADPTLGQAFHLYMQHRGYNNADIAKELNDLGIPGLSYLDQGSRAGGKGTMNHVIWDQDLLDKMIPTPVP